MSFVGVSVASVVRERSEHSCASVVSILRERSEHSSLLSSRSEDHGSRQGALANVVSTLVFASEASILLFCLRGAKTLAPVRELRERSEHSCLRERSEHSCLRERSEHYCSFRASARFLSGERSEQYSLLSTTFCLPLPIFSLFNNFFSLFPRLHRFDSTEKLTPDPHRYLFLPKPNPSCPPPPPPRDPQSRYYHPIIRIGETENRRRVQEGKGSYSSEIVGSG